MATQRDLDLIRASAAGDVERLRALLGRGAKVNTRLRNGATPVLAAAVSGRVDALRLLLIQGANLKARYKDDSTVLIMAAAQGHAGAVRLLLQKGAAIRNGPGMASALCWQPPSKAIPKLWRRCWQPEPTPMRPTIGA